MSARWVGDPLSPALEERLVSRSAVDDESGQSVRTDADDDDDDEERLGSRSAVNGDSDQSVRRDADDDDDICKKTYQFKTLC